jgi:multidrug efflux pump
VAPSSDRTRPIKFREGNDEYPIQIRFDQNQRNDLNTILSQNITYRDMNMGGMLRSVPLSALAKVEYVNTYGGIQRKNLKRVVTISSNILGGFNPNAVVAEVQAATAGL